MLCYVLSLVVEKLNFYSVVSGGSAICDKL